MIIDKPHAHAVILALKDIFERGYFADKVIERYLKQNSKWGSLDRQCFAETVYGLLRWWRRLWSIAGKDPSTDERDLWEVLAVGLWLQDTALPEWPEFADCRIEKYRNNNKGIKGQRAIEESIPDWLDHLGDRQLGERWPSVLHALNRPSEVVLRLNASRGSMAELINLLAAEDIEAVAIEKVPGALKLVERKNVFRTGAFKRGLFEVQDAASQCVVPLLDIKKGHRVIDACAGAGGKTMQIADGLADSGRVIALDVVGEKLAELKKRARRNRFSVVETRLIESTKTVKRLAQSADRVLLDVPCTGTGVLRRNPDSKWTMSQEKLDRCLALQSDILQRYSKMVKVGGRLVYATCSVLPIENDQQVQKFLSDNGADWRLVREERFWPDTFGYDGFYAACLERKP